MSIGILRGVVRPPHPKITTVAPIYRAVLVVAKVVKRRLKGPENLQAFYPLPETIPANTYSSAYNSAWCSAWASWGVAMIEMPASRSLPAAPPTW